MKIISILSIFLPMVTGILLPLIRNKTRKDKLKLVLSTMILECIFAICLVAIPMDEYTLLKMSDLLKVDIQVDALSKVFLIIDSFGFLVSGIFAFKYTETEEKHGSFKEEIFYTFFLLTLGALVGMAQTHDLIGMYVFFEFITLLSMPLVLFEKTKESINAALKYLFYSISGAFLALGMIFILVKYSSTTDFTAGGTLNLNLANENKTLVLWFVLFGIIGFGAKAGMYPLHGWLPTAHPVAPAPASAVLSGIITKAGVLAIIRVLYFVVGKDFIEGTFVQTTLLILALITVFMGSMMAYRENVLKKRLAFSSVSQISYVLFGIFLFNDTALAGSIMQIMFHSTVKICLFLFAGSIIFITGKHEVNELEGLGKSMPKTFFAFTLASLSLIGIPPFAGFVSKWYLAQGSLSSGISVISYLGPVVLLISALLTAGYLLPISIKGFFPGKDFKASEKYDDGSPLLYVPLLLLSGLSLILGIFSGIYMPLIKEIIELIF